MIAQAADAPVFRQRIDDYLMEFVKLGLPFDLFLENTTLPFGKKLAAQIKSLRQQQEQGHEQTADHRSGDVVAGQWPDQPAQTVTDEQGETSIRLGLGDIRLQARSEGKFVERYCNLAEDGVGAADADCAVTLVLKDSEAGMKDALSGVSACEWHLAKLCAPKEVVVRESVLSEEEVSRGMRRLADAVKLREERFDQLTR